MHDIVEVIDDISVIKAKPPETPEELARRFVNAMKEVSAPEPEEPETADYGFIVRESAEYAGYKTMSGPVEPCVVAMDDLIPEEDAAAVAISQQDDIGEQCDADPAPTTGRRLIDADTVVHWQSYEDETESYQEYTGTISDLLDQMTDEGCPDSVSVLPPAQPGWIQVTERLPEDGDYKPFSYYDDGAVLFCTKDGKIGFGWYYESTKQWANEDDKSPGEVIKWMPILG